MAKVKITINRPIMYSYENKYLPQADGSPTIESRTTDERVLEVLIEAPDPAELELKIEEAILQFRKEQRE